MNYLKKKIKGSKKAAAITDDDDLDPNLFHVPHSREGAPSGWVPYDERIDEESEEWKAFRLLSQRVTETLQETKENLSKIVATTALSENSRDIKQVTVSEDDSYQTNGLPTSGINRQQQQEKPERPPPPGGGATAASFSSSSSSSRPPPRPPPPNSDNSSSDKFEAAFAGSTALDFGSGFEFKSKKTVVPPRPPLPPPTTVALEFDLGHEFGFGQISPATSKSVLKATGSLFLDDDEDVLGATGVDDDGDDPFDTSFVHEIRTKSPPSYDPNDLIAVATAVATTVQSVHGVISEDDLEAFGEEISGEDDPFIVREIPVLPTTTTDTMDPFESFLQGTSSSSQSEVRARSPNPFLVDSDVDVTYTSSSNPFTCASSSNDNDPFGVQLVPNPFAEMTKTSTDDLFGFDSSSNTDVAKTEGKIKTASNFFDLLGEEEAVEVVSEDLPPPPPPPGPPSINGIVLTNPFASFAQDKEEEEAKMAPLVMESHFDPFDTIVDCSTEVLPAAAAASNNNQSVMSSQKSVLYEDPFGSHEKRGSIPAAPSSENLFSLDDDCDDNSEFFAVDAVTTTSNIPPALNLTPIAPETTTGTSKESPQIDFFSTDSEVVNVSGVSVELSEVSPATMDEFDEFFVRKEPIVPTTSAPVPVPAPVPVASGPPPRPPPPTKPARPPPPNIAAVKQPEVVAVAAAAAAEKSVWDAFSMDDVDTKMDSVIEDPFSSPIPPFKPEIKPDVVETSLRRTSGHEDVISFNAFGITCSTSDKKASVPMDDFFGGIESISTTATAATTTTLGTEVDVQPAPPTCIEDVLDFFGDIPDISPPPPPPPSDLASRKSLDENIMSESPFLNILETTISLAPTPLIEKTVEDDNVVPFTDMSTFDAFEAKFESTTTESAAMSDAFDPFSSGGGGGSLMAGFDVVTVTSTTEKEQVSQGFGSSDDFDPFFAIKETPAAPKPSPARFYTKSSDQAGDESDSDSDDTGPDFSVFIRPKMKDKDDVSSLHLGPIPALAPPPKSPMRSPPSHTSPRFNPFDKEPGTVATAAAVSEQASQFVDVDTFSAVFSEPVSTVDVPHDLPGVLSSNTTEATPKIGAMETQGESQESPGSPLFEADDTEPLEDFYPKLTVDGWDLMLRQPSKKKLTGQRFWKKVFVTLSDNGVLHLYNKQEDKDAFQELPLQACYSMTEIGAQQYDNYGKIFTVKLQYVFYRERVGVRPGQISKVTHGQVTSLGQLAKLGLPLEHSPQVSQLLKLGTQNYEELRVFIRIIEDGLFRLSVHRDRALTYKTEEVQVTVVDELRAEVQPNGVVLKQLARVRVFLLAFIVGMPDVEIGLNDITKQGKEVVGRHDIIPVITEEWIRLEKCEFHSCVMVNEFEKSRNIKFHPPDACFFEIMRFRIRPPRNRELPLQVRATMSVVGNRVEIRADVLVPGCISRKHGQIPCEDVAIRFPLPECWIYLFRVEKHFRYGSIKSAARKPGKIKGLERIMGAGLTMEPSMIEVSTGQAKYEHQHRAIVWRVPRLPKDGQGAYTTQLFVCRLELTSYDQIPAEYDRFIYVEFTMPATTVSHTTVRSVSVTNPNPPEKYVKYLARHKYRVEVEHVTATSECDYVAATTGTGGGGGGGSTSGNGSDAPSH